MFAVLFHQALLYIDLCCDCPDVLRGLLLNIVAMVGLTISMVVVKKVSSPHYLESGVGYSITSWFRLTCRWALDFGFGYAPFVITFSWHHSTTIGSNSMDAASGYIKHGGHGFITCGDIEFGTGSVVGTIVAMLLK
ncbi:hypothetical protein O9929_18510 [Vibrio lentus]|nr:hypothetical protein [Vibrio lentus]